MAELTQVTQVSESAATGTAGVTVRYFAAAKAAAGLGEEVRPLPGSGPGCSIQALLDSTPFGSAPVFARSTFLLNGVTTTDREALVHPGDTLDVLPPFAGG
ncbi:MoaD/ThiS family protein [Subtercola sp. PAMC28395]|uniref:MoaD/ThiS family protein n=1 Tax=Subtercola sp. PAMC28395 TaxID=2846775 RepID=UPI001C0E2146|nr:MoaD/ThiS family protein [Subtercola sp. PAMC28395]QWT22834.1 MoaD/ThiS family protein [Subtercola sp. PAMC28395]